MKNKKRENLIIKAIDIFVKKGIYDTTMTDIANNANVDRRTLYRYFESKNHLIVEVVVYALRIGNQFQDDLAAKQVGNGLNRFINFHYDLVNETTHHDFIKLITDFDRLKELKLAEIDQDLVNDYINEAMHSFKLKEKILAEGVADGSIKQIDTVEAARTIHNIVWAVLQKQHTSSEYIHQRLEVDFGVIIKQQLEMYKEYLKGGYPK